jgi:hypothetical protein
VLLGLIVILLIVSVISFSLLFPVIVDLRFINYKLYLISYHKFISYFCSLLLKPINWSDLPDNSSLVP